MEHAEHISKLHPALDSDNLKASSGEIRLQNQRIELFSKQLTANRPAIRAFLSTKLRCREAVEDCLQEVALTVWQKYDHRWDEESFRRFSFTCARFKALSWLKKNKPKDMVFMDVEVAEQIEKRLELLWAEEKSAASDRISLLERCISEMPERQQELLMARYGPKDGESLEEVSKKMSRSIDAVYKQLERLRAALRKCVEQRMNDL